MAYTLAYTLCLLHTSWSFLRAFVCPFAKGPSGHSGLRTFCTQMAPSTTFFCLVGVLAVSLMMGSSTAHDDSVPGVRPSSVSRCATICLEIAILSAHQQAVSRESELISCEGG